MFTACNSGSLCNWDSTRWVMEEGPHKLIVTDGSNHSSILFFECWDRVIRHDNSINTELVPTLPHVSLQLDLSKHASLKHLI